MCVGLAGWRGHTFTWRCRTKEVKKHLMQAAPTAQREGEIFERERRHYQTEGHPLLLFVLCCINSSSQILAERSRPRGARMLSTLQLIAAN